MHYSITAKNLRNVTMHTTFCVKDKYAAIAANCWTRWSRRWPWNQRRKSHRGSFEVEHRHTQAVNPSSLTRFWTQNQRWDTSNSSYVLN